MKTLILFLLLVAPLQSMDKPHEDPSCVHNELHIHVEEGIQKSSEDPEHEKRAMHIKIYIAIAAATVSGCCSALITAAVALIVHFTNCNT